MSHPIPTHYYGENEFEEKISLPNLTKEDLDIILKANAKKANNYRVNKILDPSDDYSDKMLKKLDQMAVNAMARYHNQ